ncbi:MAG: flagellar basal body P-ring protein FlgI, partial [Alphaproteobacteria bacterium]|nr:flagellar basal body P-ring protein FlgI [Alphaproteobacteria bacterium]
MRAMQRRLCRTAGPLLACLALLAASLPAAAASRVKDIADFEGIRENMLVGYGLVVGLNGSGDSLNRSIFTRESLIGMLERLGVNARDDSLRTANVAAVMVTASLPPFARQGTHIDVTVSALGDAKSLLGGTLLVTPMLGADGEVYAVAQGSVQTGLVAKGAAASVTKGVPTAGRVSNGAIVEREILFEMANLKSVNIMLHNPDLTTARRVAEVINGFLRTTAARPLDPSTVLLTLPT